MCEARRRRAQWRAPDSDVEAVAESGANWVGIFAGVNEYSQRFRLRKSQTEILDIPPQALAGDLLMDVFKDRIKHVVVLMLENRSLDNGGVIYYTP